MPKQSERDIRRAIAINLIQYRNREKLTQTQLAEKIKSTRERVAQYETKKAKPPLPIMHNISHLLGMSIGELTGICETC